MLRWSVLTASWVAQGFMLDTCLTALCEKAALVKPDCTSSSYAASLPPLPSAPSGQAVVLADIELRVQVSSITSDVAARVCSEVDVLSIVANELLLRVMSLFSADEELAASVGVASCGWGPCALGSFSRAIPGRSLDWSVGSGARRLDSSASGSKPNLPYPRVAMSSTFLCVLDISLTAHCREWVADDQEDSWRKWVFRAEEKLVAIDCAVSMCCAIGEASTAVECWDILTNVKGVKLTTGATSLSCSAATDYCCVVTEAQSLSCWQGLDGALRSVVSGNVRSAAVATAESFCVIMVNGKLLCWGFSDVDTASLFSYLKCAATFCCGLSVDGLIECFSDGVVSSSSFTKALSGVIDFAIKGDELVLVYDTFKPSEESISYGVFSVAARESHLCFVRLDYALFCDDVAVKYPIDSRISGYRLRAGGEFAPPSGWIVRELSLYSDSSCSSALAITDAMPFASEYNTGFSPASAFDGRLNTGWYTQETEKGRSFIGLFWLAADSAVSQVKCVLLLQASTFHQTGVVLERWTGRAFGEVSRWSVITESSEYVEYISDRNQAVETHKLKLGVDLTDPLSTTTSLPTTPESHDHTNTVTPTAGPGTTTTLRGGTSIFHTPFPTKCSEDIDCPGGGLRSFCRQRRCVCNSPWWNDLSTGCQVTLNDRDIAVDLDIEVSGPLFVSRVRQSGYGLYVFAEILLHEIVGSAPYMCHWALRDVVSVTDDSKTQMEKWSSLNIKVTVKANNNPQFPNALAAISELSTSFESEMGSVWSSPAGELLPLRSEGGLVRISRVWVAQSPAAADLPMGILEAALSVRLTAWGSSAQVLYNVTSSEIAGAATTDQVLALKSVYVDVYSEKQWQATPDLRVKSGETLDHIVLPNVPRIGVQTTTTTFSPPFSPATPTPPLTSQEPLSDDLYIFIGISTGIALSAMSLGCLCVRRRLRADSRYKSQVEGQREQVERGETGEEESGKATNSARFGRSGTPDVPPDFPPPPCPPPEMPGEIPEPLSPPPEPSASAIGGFFTLNAAGSPTHSAMSPLSPFSPYGRSLSMVEAPTFALCSGLFPGGADVADRDFGGICRAIGGWLQASRSQLPRHVRRKQLRLLAAKWHPDKFRPTLQHEVADDPEAEKQLWKQVFQYVQEKKPWFEAPTAAERSRLDSGL